MGLVDKLKAYLNEEDLPEEDANDNAPGSERKSADGRVRLQAIDEEPGVQLALSDEAKKEIAKAAKKEIKKTKEKKVPEKHTTIGERARERNINFVDETLPKKKSPDTDTIRDSEEEAKERLNGVGSGRREDKLRKKAEKQRAKAVKRLARTIKKREKVLGDDRVREDKGKRKKEKIRSEGADIESLIVDKATKEEAERQTVTDFCEQLIDVSFHMEDMKKEYKLVSTYLMDIQRIDELPIEYANEVIELASQIDRLDRNREEYLQSENLLSEEQYAILAQLEKEVPGTIKKLYDMESRDTMLRSDMGHLEGEKADLRYMREEFSDSIARIRGIVSTVLILGILTLGVVACVAYISRSTVTVYVLAIVAFVMVVFAVGYARYASIRNEVRMNDARLAKAISLLNKVKVKYINNTNTLDYIYDKYGVHSSSELEYVWERYNTMVRDMLRYSEANKGLREAKEELIAKLKSFGLQEAEVWPSQIMALIDRREMVEIRHTLNTRRQKLRESIETCERIRSNAITALRASVAENPGMAEHIQDILKPYHLTIF